jgi:MerR family mercuric resistance operon transcriptional regulator
MIEEPPRTESGYRQYPAEVIARIRFIKKGQSLGFSLGEIRELLSLRVEPDTTAADIRERAQKKIQEIDEKIQALEQMKQALEKVMARCHGDGPSSDCPILEMLETDN